MRWLVSRSGSSAENLAVEKESFSMRRRVDLVKEVQKKIIGAKNFKLKYYFGMLRGPSGSLGAPRGDPSGNPLSRMFWEYVGKYDGPKTYY